MIHNIFNIFNWYQNEPNGLSSTATTSEYRNLISSASYKEDCEDNWLKCLNTWIDSLLPVQEGSSITTLMTEQETMEQNSWLYSIHQLRITFTQLKQLQPGMPYQVKL